VSVLNKIEKWVGGVIKKAGHIKINVTTKGQLTFHNTTFPCKECVVEASCSKPCDKLERDEQIIMETIIDYQGCIDCGSKQMYEGPSGGLSQNIKCAQCEHEFNLMIPMKVGRIGTFT